jgi:hypothetical protein
MRTSFVEQIHNSQITTSTTIQDMIAQRDETLHHKMNEHLALILGKLSNEGSPIRKKQTIMNDDDHSLENVIDLSTQHTAIPNHNPYYPNSIRRRSVQQTPPTMAP